MYRKEHMTMWTTMLPKQYQRYKIVRGTDVIGAHLTEAEADALLKLLIATID